MRHATSITTSKARPKAYIRKEVAVDHGGKAPSPPTKKARSPRTRPRTASTTPSAAPDLFLASSYLPSPKTTSSKRTSTTRHPKLHRPPPKYVLNPTHLHFSTTNHPALYSHHLLPFALTDKYYKSLKSPLSTILKKQGLRTSAKRIKITAFRRDLKDNQSKYLVEGHPVQSGATASNKTPEPALLRPEWLLAGATECGKCGSSFGKISSGMKTCNRQIGYHQGTLTRRSRSKKTPGMILPPTISTCKAVDRLTYANN